TSKQSSNTGSLTPRCEPVAMSGSLRGCFHQLRAEALAVFDRIIGLDLSEVAVDGSLHKAPYGGEGTGPNPCDRGKCGWKWSLGVERHKIPLGWAIEGANRNDDHRTPRSASPSPCSSSADHLTETSGCQRGSENDTGSSNMNCVR
ncbi:MAG: hypothetical protein ACRDS0_39330, partial [Pseudonocardiaceae bacterium]